LFYVLFVCKCVLPPGDNPIAVNKYIISYHFLRQNIATRHTTPSYTIFSIHLNIPGQQSAHSTSNMCTRLIRLGYRCQMTVISLSPYIKHTVYLLTLVIVT